MKANANRARGAGLYLGEFNSDFSKVARRVQVTHDDKGDYYVDAWLYQVALQEGVAALRSHSGQVS